MGAQRFIRELADAGVGVLAEGGRLAVEGPQEALSRERTASLWEHKADLL